MTGVSRWGAFTGHALATIRVCMCDFVCLRDSDLANTIFFRVVTGVVILVIRQNSVFGRERVDAVEETLIHRTLALRLR